MNADQHSSAEFQEVETNGAARCIGKARFVQADAAQGAQQHVGHRIEPETELIGPHGCGRGAVGMEIELALLDPVFHVFAGAVYFVIESVRKDHIGLQSFLSMRRMEASLRNASAL